MLPLSYILLSLIMIALIFFTIHKVHLSAGISAKKAMQKAAYILIIWLTYLFMLSTTKFLQGTELPPRLPLFLFVPIAIFTLIYCIRASKSEWIKYLKLTDLTYPQSFRIFVELILLYTFYANLIPMEATFEGYNFDVLMGVSAPFVAYFAFKKPKINITFAYFWNILGILMVLFVAFIIGTAFFNPMIWGSKISLVDPRFVTLPYLLIAGFLAPLAIFMHALSIVKIKSLKV